MKHAFLILAMVGVCAGSAFAQIEKEPVEKVSDYWVYVRLEDRSGVTADDDVGRSKAGDVVAVLPVNPQNIPSETEKKEWMIYKTALTETERQALLETWEETQIKTESFDLPKEMWENAGKKQEFLDNIRSVEVVSEKASQVTTYEPVKQEDLSKYSQEELFIINIAGGVPVVKNVYSVAISHEYQKPIAYRKNKLDTSKLGVAVKTGLVAEKIDASKIETSVKTTEDFARYEMKRKFYAYVQRPLKIVSNQIIGVAHAETVSTINKAGEDYNTLTLWEDAVDGDLVTATSQPTAECYDDDGQLADGAIVDGSTTSSAYYMKITSPEGERHNGTIGGGGFYVKSTGWRVCAIDIRDTYAIVDWVIMEATNDTSGLGIWMGSEVAASTVRHCIIKSVKSIGIRGFANLENNIITTTGSAATCIDLNFPDLGATINIKSNTCVTLHASSGGGILIQANRGTINIVNNISISKTGASYVNVAYADVFSNNAGSDTSGNVDNIDSTSFVDYANYDYHLVSDASLLINSGADLSGTFTTDIDGDTRPTGVGTWDIGADEYVSVEPPAGNVPTPYYYYHLLQGEGY